MATDKKTKFPLAESVLSVLPDSRWIGARFARAQISLGQGEPAEAVAREIYERGGITLTRSREAVEKLRGSEFTALLDPRKKTSSAENPVTKLFPAAVTERHFLDELDLLRQERPSIDYRDERFGGHTLVDFTILEHQGELPINVKNAGTRFEQAQQLVGLEPDDCIPIPAYKAHDAVEKEPNLLYAIAIDYTLIKNIEERLLSQFNNDESEVWTLLNRYSGSLIRDAEDTFIYSMVNKYWPEFSLHSSRPSFRIISARKAIKVLHQLPKRTPGIGLRAWGTGASAEVNVHISVKEETKEWEEIHARLREKGVEDIIKAVNRKRTQVVFDPEI